MQSVLLSPVVPWPLAPRFHFPWEGNDLLRSTLLKMLWKHLEPMCAVGARGRGAECCQVCAERAARPDVNPRPYLWAVAEHHKKEPDRELVSLPWP